MKRILAALTAALLLLTLTACGGNGNQTGGVTVTGGSSTEKEVLTLATSADFPPYEFVDDNGGYAGIDIEIAGLIADELGMTLQVENMDFDSVITATSTGKCDIGMAGLTKTEDRLKSVDFSDTYAIGVQVLIVKKGSPITSVDDLYGDGATYKVGVQLSTTGDIYFSGDVKNKKTTCTVEQYTLATDAIQALVNGQVDAVLIDNEPAKSFVKANDGLTILEAPYAEEEYAIALKKDSELTAKINAALKKLSESGKITEVVNKYIPAE